MEFSEKLDKFLNERATNKTAVARQMGIPQTTFLYKSKALERWNVVEYKRLCTILRLNDEEIAFLSDEVG